MELGEGGRVHDPYNLLGDSISEPLPALPSSLTSLLASSSRLVLSGDPSALGAYRPWEQSHETYYHILPAGHPHLNHHPHAQLAAAVPAHASPHATLTHLGHHPTCPGQPLSHYASPPMHTTFVETFHHVPGASNTKLPPFSALSPDRNVEGASPLPSFSTLPSPHSRYPLVPAPIQARDIPTVQQQIMDERHIHMFESPQGDTDASSSTPQGHPSPSRLSVPPHTPTSVNTSPSQPYENGRMEAGTQSRRGRRTCGAICISRSQNSHSIEDETVVSGTENSGQVSSVSSSAPSDASPVIQMAESSFRSPQAQHQQQQPQISQPQVTPPLAPPPPQEDPPEKPVKKKRKRCGDCVGCQRKDNCGDCAPCRNDKSHQICKMRRCDKLTEKRTPRGEKMDRRGSGMGPMMPFFPGGAMGEQPPTMPNPDMPPFPHMRERFPNAVWGPESQGQWGAFHPPGLAPPQMGPPSHPAPQYNQYEPPRQQVFNFASTGAPPAAPGSAPVAQFNSGYNGQYNGSTEPASGYVPQGHFSPQAASFNSGPPNGFLSHGQGNGLMGGGAPPSHNHPHQYPVANDYSHHHQQQQQPTHHMQQQQQQGVFKSPLPSPAVSAPEASPVQGGFAMAPMSSPNEQSPTAATVHTSMPCRVPNYGSDCGSTPLPQASPHSSISTSSTSQSISNSNGNGSLTSGNGSSVQSRLKNMIMSRQSSNGSQGSSFSPGPGLTDSPPMGELRFSGSVAAVTSVASSADPSQVQESFKMAQNFLAYRTTESDPGSVVQDSSVREKGDSGNLNHVSNLQDRSLLSTINTYEDSQQHQIFESKCQQADGHDKSESLEVSSFKSEICNSSHSVETEGNFKQPEEALEELFKGTEDNNVDKIITCPAQSDCSSKESDQVEENTQNNMVISANCQDGKGETCCVNKISSETSVPVIPSSGMTTEGVVESSLVSNMAHLKSESSSVCLDKSSSLSVYDFPDSPDQQQSSANRSSGFRLGRVRGSSAIPSSSQQRFVSVSVQANAFTRPPGPPPDATEGIEEGGTAEDPSSSSSTSFPSSAPANPPPRNTTSLCSTQSHVLSIDYGSTTPSVPSLPHLSYSSNSQSASSLPHSRATLQSPTFSCNPLSDLNSMVQTESISRSLSSNASLNSLAVQMNPTSSLAPQSMYSSDQQSPINSYSSSSHTMQPCHGSSPTSDALAKYIPASNTYPATSQAKLQGSSSVQLSTSNCMGNASQNTPHLSPQNMPPPSPQTHQSPQAYTPMSTPQNLPQHSPQSLPHIPHQSPQTQALPHYSPQAMPYQSPQTMPQSSFASMSQQSPISLPHQSPQTMPPPSPQTVLHQSPHPSQSNSHPSPQNVSNAHPLNHSSPQSGPHTPAQLVSNVSFHSQIASPHLSPQNAPPQPSPQNVGDRDPVPQNVQSQLLPQTSKTIPSPGQAMFQPSLGIRHLPPHHPQLINQHAGHLMPQTPHPYQNPFAHNYPQMNHSFPHQFHPQMHMIHPSNQPMPAFNVCQHPMKTMSNITVPPNMQQPCESLPPKAPPKKPAAKRQPRKRAGPTKKQKQQQQRQQKEEMEKLKLQEMQQEKLQKEEMEKLRFQELQQQQQYHRSFQAAPQLQSFIGSKCAPPHQFVGHTHIAGNPDPDLMPQQWNQRFALSPFHPQNMHVIHPYPDPIPVKGSSKNQGSKSKKKNSPKDPKFSGTPNRSYYQSDVQSGASQTLVDNSHLFRSKDQITDYVEQQPYPPSLKPQNIDRVPQAAEVPSQQKAISLSIMNTIEHVVAQAGRSNPINNQSLHEAGSSQPPCQTSLPGFLQEKNTTKSLENESTMVAPPVLIPENNYLLSPGKSNENVPKCVMTPYNYANQCLGNVQTDSQHPLTPTPLHHLSYQLDPPEQTREHKARIPGSAGVSPSAVASSRTLQQTMPTMQSQQVKQEPSQGLELPPDDEHKQRLRSNEQIVPRCSCPLPPGTQDPGPVYAHLGCGRTLHDVRNLMEKRSGLEGGAVRIEKIIYTGKEGKTDSGCPLPKWIIRRSGPQEKLLVIVKHRSHHVCSSTWMVAVVVAWEAIPPPTADDLYNTLVDKLNRYGNPTERRCGTNDDRTCVCQGIESDACGASFSFGCSWSMYYNMCKFARSKHTRKFRLTDEQSEREVEMKMQSLATEIAPVYQRLVPEAFSNQVALEDESLECRLGNKAGRPWTGVTACLDFCAHSHKDNHNMNNGCTVVATLTKHRGVVKPDDEQYHVLPLYVLDPTDEAGGYNSFHDKVSSGCIEVLNKYPCQIRLRSEPLLSCRARTLLARGLPLPNATKAKMSLKSKTKCKMVAEMRRKSCERFCSFDKKKNDVKEVSDKLGLDVDYMIKTGDFEDDDLSKYSLEGDDYSWLLDLGNDNVAGGFKRRLGDEAKTENEKKRKDESNLTKCSSEATRECRSALLASAGTPEVGGLALSMPPPPSPTLKPSLSPSGENSSHPFSQHSSPPNLSPLNSPFFPPPPQPLNTAPSSPHNSQSPVESSLNTSSPSNFSSVSHFSPFSPQMPSLSPQGSSPSPPGKSIPNITVPPSHSPSLTLYSAASSYAPNSIPPLLSTAPTSLFGSSSHNSPEMPRLSPHITSSPLGGLAKTATEKQISSLALSNKLSFNQNLNTQNHRLSMDMSQVPQLNRHNQSSLKPEEKVTSSTEPGSLNSESKNSLNFFPPPEKGSSFANEKGETDNKPYTYSSFSNNLDNFEDPDIGGVAIALTHGSVLFEYAKHELHATTALKQPDRRDPKRLSLIFYHHKNLIYRNHGWTELELKMEKKKLEVEREGMTNKKAKKNKKDSVKVDLDTEPLNGLKRLKYESNPHLQPIHPLGYPVDHKKHLVSDQPAMIYQHGNPQGNPGNPPLPLHPDLVCPPVSYANYPQPLSSFIESTRPYSPSQRNTSTTSAFSISSKSSSHLITSQSPTLDQNSPKPISTVDHNYSMNSHIGPTPGATAPPFNTALQEFNPFSTPGSSPYHNHFSPYVDMQGNPNFASYQHSNFFTKGPSVPVNYNTTTYVPQPFYGLTPPYSPGPQQPPHQGHHIQSQLPPGQFSSSTPLMSPYEDGLNRGPPTQPTNTWSQVRHMPSFHVHGPYAPWPGS